MKVFFDLDGTIIDVSQRYYRIYSDIIRRLDAVPIGFETYWEKKKERVSEHEIMILSDIDHDKAKEYLAERGELIESDAYLEIDTLISGAQGLFEVLGASHELYIVTMRKRRVNLLRQIERLGIGGYFKSILSIGAAPDPAIAKAEAIMAECSVCSSDIIAGDTEADIRAGKILGIRTCAVLTGIRSERLLSLEAPDHIMESITKLTGVVHDEGIFS
ncbi:MAG: HAD hydrolase-like protein [Deltaproteobacteria bacterium]